MKYLSIFFISISFLSFGQENIATLSKSMFNARNEIQLADMDGWEFHEGDEARLSEITSAASGWTSFKPTQLSSVMEDGNGKVEGWFRLTFKIDESLRDTDLGLTRDLWSATDIYLDGNLFYSFGSTQPAFHPYTPDDKYPIPINLLPGKEYVLAMHFVNYESFWTSREKRLKPQYLANLLSITGEEYTVSVTRSIKESYIYNAIWLATSTLLLVLFMILMILAQDNQIFRFIVVLSAIVVLFAFTVDFNFLIDSPSMMAKNISFGFWAIWASLVSILNLLIIDWIFKKRVQMLTWVIIILHPTSSILVHTNDIPLPFTIINTIFYVYFFYTIFSHRHLLTKAHWAIIIGMIVQVSGVLGYIILHRLRFDIFLTYEKPIVSFVLLSIPIALVVYVAFTLKEVLQAEQEKAENVRRLSAEKEKILAEQNVVLEQKVDERTSELNQSLETLQTTQAQLIQSEKMASLGELTAGIAHEIQNPLNFVNNFSEMNAELIKEIQEERLKTQDLRDEELETEILADIGENEEKIKHHGQRASGIVKGMLEHSRTGDGEKEPTDINALAEEYLRLSYHGLRAKDKSFNADFKLEADESLPKINVVPQDIGRVLLNLINNAFHAVNERAQKEPDTYKPTVTVSTSMSPSSGGGKGEEKVQVTVSDNGSGIPDSIRDKIFQPFFTTKATGEGTGLGLSLSYDIVTKGHGGTIEVKSDPGKRTEFLIILPIGDQ